MKRFVLTAIAVCFIFAANSEAFSQTRTITRKRTKAKLVKCYEKGKAVYRKRCSLKRNPTNEVKAKIEPKKETYEIAPTGGIGIGNGRGTGVGNGRGQGNGNETGMGNGSGDGLGDGNGNTNTDKKETTLLVGATTPLKILSKPRPNYTDAARVNMVEGKVLLRVTFSANGKIGAISVISALGNGLTEKAIEAARQIKFEPATKNGVPYSVTKTVEYNFIPE